MKKEILFYGVMLLIPLLFIELSLQAYYRIVTGSFLFERMVLPIYAADENRFYRLKSDLAYQHKTNEYDVTYYTNSEGLRTDAEKKVVPIEKADNVYRILFMGPSFAFGWGSDYEDSYVSRISKALKLDGKKIEVINLGTPAQPIPHQLCWLEKKGFEYKPDMIVQTIYGNPEKTPAHCSKTKRPPVVKDGFIHRSKITTKTKIINEAKKSAIVFYGWYLYQALLPTNDEIVGAGTELYEDETQSTEEQNTDNKTYEKYANKYKAYTQFVSNTLNYEPAIVFLHVPYSYVVRPEDSSRWEHIKEFKTSEEMKRSSKEIGKLLQKMNISYVNPLDELIEQDKLTRMYYFLDIHFTPEGNKVLADKATPVIQKLMLKN